MDRTPSESGPNGTRGPFFLAYIADLELEVDRLRKQGQVVRHEVSEAIKKVNVLCARDQTTGNASLIGEIEAAVGQIASLLRDTRESVGHHPAYDHVAGIAIRPFVDQVFRWQQRLQGAPDVKLRQELEVEQIEWFPARLRHILDNLISNALRFRDSKKTEHWVNLALRVSTLAYEFRLSDNGVGMAAEQQQVVELLSWPIPSRVAGMGVGLSVVRLLVEQSGGTLAVDSGVDQGSTFVAELPRYDIDDYLTELSPN
jgi:signal transduction histidine kinase